MNIQWAAEQLALGKKVKRSSWTGYYCVGGGYICQNQGNKSVFTIEDMLATDWEEVGAPIELCKVKPGKKFKLNTSSQEYTKIHGGQQALGTDYKIYTWVDDTKVIPID